MYRATFFLSGILAATIACGTDTPAAAKTLPDACAGIVPALTNGSSSYTVVGVEPNLPTTCSNPLGDGAGNVYITAFSGESGSNNLGIFNHTTAVVLNQLSLAPLQSGFTGVTSANDGSRHYTGFKPDGSTANDTVVPGQFAIDARGASGSVIVSYTCNTSGNPVVFTIQVFDDTAALSSTVTFSETQCPGGDGNLTVDTSGNVLLAFETGSAGLFGLPAGTTALRWFDPVHNAPLTDWFDRQGTGAYFPLIGGGLVTHFASDGSWKFIPSGKAELDTAPSFLEATKFPVIVRGGKAYAMITGSAGIPDIFLADGTACGPLPGPNISASDSFAIGKDGTLIDSKGAGNCTVTAFPQALQ